MWLDIVMGIILIVSVFIGFQQGFIQAFIRTVGWLLSVILGFFFYPKVAALIADKTNLDTFIHSGIASQLTDGGQSLNPEILSHLPEVISKAIESAINSAADAVAITLADRITDLVLSVISFLLIVVAIRIVFGILSMLFSKQRNDGFTGMVDGMAGGLFGAARGFLIVSLLLALMVPLMGMMKDSSFLTKALSDSTFAQYLYNHNILLLLFHK